MERKNAKKRQIIFTILLILSSPILFMASIFALAGGGNLLSMGKSDGLPLVLIGFVPVYLILVNVFGWFVILNNKPHDSKVFLYPLFITLGLIIYFTFSIGTKWIFG